MESKKWYQREWVKSLGVVLLFMVIALVYFTPAAFEGRVLLQADGVAASGTGQDVVRHEEATGERSLWTGSLFGGMPMYQISPSYPSSQGIKAVQNLYRLRLPFANLLPGDSYLIFIMLLGFYLFMRSWGVQRLLSVGGALLWAFSSYFLILIDAGHIWKLLTLAYIPPTLAGLVLAFHRKKYLLGFLVTGLFSALQLYSNHIQMSYYFAFLMGAMLIAWAVQAYRTKAWAHYGKALATVVLGGVVGIAINGTSLYHTYQYSKETMRGGSELATTPQEGNNQGLDKGYITQWSYGIDEMLTFLIPDAKGGFSSHIGTEEEALKKVQPAEVRQVIAGQNRYWGNQPFTAGPVYVGAVVLLLAIFAAIVARGPMKWALLATTLLTIMLSWGHNFMWLTSLFIDYVPLYNKFRTPSSILVVAEMTVVLFAIWALVLLAKEPQLLKQHKKAVAVSLLATLGVALAVAIAPKVAGPLLSNMEQAQFGKLTLQHPELAIVVQQLEAVRTSILRADALRSVLLLLIGATLIYLYYKGKLSNKVMVASVLLLCFADLWSVDKRYLNDAKYLPPRKVAEVNALSDIDKIILADSTQHRVLNLTVNTFNDATTSYHHRSVGGYHAAKLQRYQDLIEGYLSQLHPGVLRMLNTKYIIHPEGLVTDSAAYGDAWFVEKVKAVTTPHEEFAALGTEELWHTAIVAEPFAQKLTQTEYHLDSLAQVTLTHYAPNEVRYRTNNSAPGLVVFSEIYYPHGWHATIDGQPTPILRANYLLRALQVPSGTHDIVFRFAPKSVQRTELVAYTASLLLLVVALGLLGHYLYKRKRHASHTP